VTSEFQGTSFQRTWGR